MKQPILYITAIFNLKIAEDLGKGISIHGVYLTNNKGFIRSLLTDELYEAIGNLEFGALHEAEAIFYKISDEVISGKNDDQLLTDFLGNCKIIINQLWLAKDHSIDVMLGFVQYPFFNGRNIKLPYYAPIIHSNMISGNGYTSTGVKQETIYHRKDLEQIIIWGESLLIEPFSQTEKRKTAISPGIQRITRATAFLQTARQQIDLGIKITHYCSALECLFSTSTTELTHKLSERVAYFLETEPQNRIIIYEQLKNIYSIRSQVTHGSTISKKLIHKISDYSKKADDILRRVFIRLEGNEHLDQYYRKDNSEELEKYLTELTLGYDKFADKTSPSKS